MGCCWNGIVRTFLLCCWNGIRYKRFYGRIVVSSILVLLLYPFLLAWTVIGTLWFTRSKDCLPEDGQKWGFLIWLLFSYCGLVCIACLCLGKVPLGEVRCRNRLKTSHSASNSEKLVTLLTLTELSHYYENRLILFRNEALLRQLLL